MSKVKLVGVSGGPDSMALLDLARKKSKVWVVHVNYHQRESAYRDQLIVEAYCHKYQIEYDIIDAPEDYVGNFQAFARDFRMKAFVAIAHRVGAKQVLLAHHLDDQLETIMMTLISERNPSYLGIAKKQIYQDIELVRPLLKYHKNDLIHYCDNHQIEYGIDESNHSLKYKRNQVRQVLSDFNQQKIAVILQYQKHYNKRQFKQHKLLNKYSSKDTLLVNDYRKYPQSVRLRLLRSYLLAHDIDVYQKRLVYFKSLDERLLDGKTQTIELNSEKGLTIQYGDASITSLYTYDFEVKFGIITHTTNDFFKTMSTGPSTSGVTLSEADFPITIRNARAGDKIKMFYGTKRVAQFFKDRKIPLDERKRWPVVENAAKEIVLVVGLGCDKVHYSPNPNLYVLK